MSRSLLPWLNPGKNNKLGDVMQNNIKRIEVPELRIKRILRENNERNKVQADIMTLLENLGLDNKRAKELCEQIFALYLSTNSLAAIDLKAYELARQTEVVVDTRKISLLEMRDNKLSQRLATTFAQYAEYLKGETGKVIDYGAGDGVFTQMLHDKLGLDIEGVDIKATKAAGVNVPILRFNGEHVPVADKYYSAGIVNLVLHHEANNEKILMELDRIVSNKLIIKENVPVGATAEEMLQDMDRTFMLDYLMARMFHNYVYPTPGTFETPVGWKSRFLKYGWKVQHERDLGFDVPYLPLRKYLLVLTK